MNKDLIEFINNSPYLISVLYDLNLLPEQVKNDREQELMMAIAAAYFKGLSN